jgi:hypothetical protein
MDEDHGGDSYDDQVLGLGKKKKKNNKSSRQRYKWLGVFFLFW